MINLPKPKKYFVTATGTNIGKTHFIEQFCQKIIQENKNIFVQKPIISGFDENKQENDQENDLYRILKAKRFDVNAENINKINLYRFAKPLSPDQISKDIDYDKIVDFCQNNLNKNYDYHLIEGVGGLYVPINNKKRIIDLIKDLNIQVILISASYLGALSHIFSAYENIKNLGLELEKIYLNDFPAIEQLGLTYIDAKQNYNSLKNFISASKLEIFS